MFQQEQIQLPPSLIQKYKLLEIKKGEVECLQDKIRQDREALRVKNEVLRSIIARAKEETRKEQEKQRNLKDAQEEALVKSKNQEIMDRASEVAKDDDIRATLSALVGVTNATLSK